MFILFRQSGQKAQPRLCFFLLLRSKKRKVLQRRKYSHAKNTKMSCAFFVPNILVIKMRNDIIILLTY